MIVKHAKHVQINTDILLGGSFRSTSVAQGIKSIVYETGK